MGDYRRKLEKGLERGTSSPLPRQREHCPKPPPSLTVYAFNSGTLGADQINLCEFKASLVNTLASSRPVRTIVVLCYRKKERTKKKNPKKQKTKPKKPPKTKKDRQQQFKANKQTKQNKTKPKKNQTDQSMYQPKPNNQKDKSRLA